MRIDRWIRNNIASLPQSLIEKSLRKGKIKVNIKKVNSSYKLKKGDKVKFFNFTFDFNKKKETSKKFSPSSELLKVHENRILENNDDFIVIDKSPGVPVQGGTKSKKNLIDIFKKSEFFINSKPYSVHRLDKDTSGIFLIAKNRKTAQLLTSLFRLRRVHKTYLAICHGPVNKKHGTLKDSLVRYDNNKKIIEYAESSFKVIDKNSLCSLVEMKPVTGRKHQLRKQLLLLGHPIIGDTKYNLQSPTGTNKKDHLMLHSYEIKFMINGKKYTFNAPIPVYFEKYLKIKRLRF